MLYRLDPRYTLGPIKILNGEIDQISSHFRGGNIFCFWVCSVLYKTWISLMGPNWKCHLEQKHFCAESFVRGIPSSRWLSIILCSFWAKVILCSFCAEWPQFNGGAVQYKASISSAIWEPERGTKQNQRSGSPREEPNKIRENQKGVRTRREQNYAKYVQVIRTRWCGHHIVVHNNAMLVSGKVKKT